MKATIYILIALVAGVVLSFFIAGSMQNAIPVEFLSAIDPGFVWDMEGKALQVNLVYEPGGGFTVNVKNVSDKVVSIRGRLRAVDSANHDIGERGEGAFQLFLINSEGEKVSLHQYANQPNAAMNEIDMPLDPGKTESSRYHALPGDTDSKRIGKRQAVAGVRYFEWDPRASGAVNAEGKEKLKAYVTWSNEVYLPDIDSQ